MSVDLPKFNDLSDDSKNESTNIFSSNFFAKQKRKSAVEIVIDRFKELFFHRLLKPGDKIPSEMELAESLNLGRGSIREAIKVLASYSILEIRRGDGTYVSKNMGNSLFDHLLFQILASDFDHRNLIELRQLMEYGVVDYAIAKCGPEDLPRIEEAHAMLTEMVRAGDHDPEKLCNGERDFHLGISLATHNELVHKIYSFTLELILPTIQKTFIYRPTPGDFQIVIDTHEDIMESLRKRDPEMGRKAVAKSIDSWVISMDYFK